MVIIIIIAYLKRSFYPLLKSDQVWNLLKNQDINHCLFKDWIEKNPFYNDDIDKPILNPFYKVYFGFA